MRANRAVLIAAYGLSGACRMPASLPAGTVRVVAEEHSPGIADEVLVEDVGIETLGGVFTVLLARGVPVPAAKTEVFSTATDNQDQIEIRLYRGTAPLVTQNTSLGRFTLTKIPPAPRGVPKLQVTFRVEDETIAIEAREANGAEIQLARR